MADRKPSPADLVTEWREGARLMEEVIAHLGLEDGDVMYGAMKSSAEITTMHADQLEAALRQKPE